MLMTFNSHVLLSQSEGEEKIYQSDIKENGKMGGIKILFVVVRIRKKLLQLYWFSLTFNDLTGSECELLSFPFF